MKKMKKKKKVEMVVVFEEKGEVDGLFCWRWGKGRRWPELGSPRRSHGRSAGGGLAWASAISWRRRRRKEMRRREEEKKEKEKKKKKKKGVMMEGCD